MPGALALGDRYSLDFLSPLIQQTREMRKSDEELDEEAIADNEARFWEKNQNKKVILTNSQGKKTKIALAQFNVNPDRLMEDFKNAHNLRVKTPQSGDN